MLVFASIYRHTNDITHIGVRMVTKKTSSTTKKRSAAAKSGSKKSASHNVTYQSFKVASDAGVFFKPRVTKQTFYWSALLLFIIIMQLIIIAMNVNATISLDNLR